MSESEFRNHWEVESIDYVGLPDCLAGPVALCSFDGCTCGGEYIVSAAQIEESGHTPGEWIWGDQEAVCSNCGVIAETGVESEEEAWVTGPHETGLEVQRLDIDALRVLLARLSEHAGGEGC